MTLPDDDGTKILTGRADIAFKWDDLTRYHGVFALPGDGLTPRYAEYSRALASSGCSAEVPVLDSVLECRAAEPLIP
jgi:hypothetical protein